MNTPARIPTQASEVDEALQIADQAQTEDLRGMYPMSARVLADEVRRLRQQVTHLEGLALRARSDKAVRQLTN